MVKRSLCKVMVIPTLLLNIFILSQDNFDNTEVSVFKEIMVQNENPDSLEKTLYKEQVNEVETITVPVNMVNLDEGLEIKQPEDEAMKVDDVLLEAQQLFDKKEYLSSKILIFLTILGSEGDSVEPNKYATDLQKEKAIYLIKLSEEALMEKNQE